MKTLKDILKNITPEAVIGDLNQPVSRIVIDSKEAGKESVFVAIKGLKADGHEFIEQAILKEARAIVCQTLPTVLYPRVTYIQVKNTTMAVGPMASAFFDSPSQKLALVGITGTNGKTTIATLLYRLFKQLGYSSGLISTIENRIDDEVFPAHLTTPDAISLNSLLYKMVEAGCSHVFMEVSSHAIVQGRVNGLDFSGGIFTNLTHDHLDYHKTFANYRDAKKMFFDQLGIKAFALSNADDPNGEIMLQNTKARKYFYGLRNLADFHARILEMDFDGMFLNIDGNEAWFRLTGRFNAYNLLAIYGAAVLLGELPEKVLQVMSNLQPAEGRLETLKSEEGITAIVDYAHTPDALQNVIETIHDILGGGGRLIVVCGAGGDRDKTKRPKMAAIAAENADHVLLTSDNPRTEDPIQIINDMKSGLNPSLSYKVLSIPDRHEAIHIACMMAKAGDVILVAGKGHEKYQEINGIKYPFSDKEILSQYLHFLKQS
ncbi:MAG TPA: UDP-N-acetylmuramoyl-L-alanyl-D-glutamate--2,6-diaminopimelate ligase [Bacteroidales bacterium]|nr:UDP-N-acetylmuramoyl-L-alanyl-D-glutamate--2,6-diaminopimelate ligase [Bacteroidales bacterium]